MPHHLTAERFQSESVVQSISDAMTRRVLSLPVPCAVPEFVPAVTDPRPADSLIWTTLDVLPELRLLGCSFELYQIAGDDTPPARRLGDKVRNRMRARPVTVPDKAVAHVIKLCT